MSLFALKIERTQDLEYLTKERFCSICKNLTIALTCNNPQQCKHEQVCQKTKKYHRNRLGCCQC